ncbi:MAG: transglycosylase SLT domain-containing protein [Bacteroidota bacterium]
MKAPVVVFAFSLLLGSCQEIPPPGARAAVPEDTGSQFVRKTIVSDSDTTEADFLSARALYSEGWDTLAHPRFWKQIMCLSPDSCIINIAESRLPIQTACFRTWNTQSETEKSVVKNRLREEYCIDYDDELFVTNGKREFYEHRKSIPTIAKAVSYFQQYGTDPWYAQTILLIESPGKHSSQSYAGARGPFQLMRSVALQYGLKVNKYVDERTRLDRAAYGASRLISSICLPKVRSMLDTRNIPYKETDLWFRLLVLHAYHAGSGNLSAAINKINPDSGGQWLITTLWKTQAGGFKNESQNYSQIALAALLNFDELLRIDGDTVFMVWGNRALSTGRDGKRIDWEACTEALFMYEKDLADGTLDYPRFIEKIREVQASALRISNNPLPYPADEEQLIRTAARLSYKRQYTDAIRLLELNLEYYPNSLPTRRALGKTHQRAGNPGMAQKYLSSAQETGSGL